MRHNAKARPAFGGGLCPEHAATWQGKNTGAFGDVGCFSFYPTKGLGAFGDGGAVICGSAELAGQFRTFRNYGSKQKYQFEVVGANSRLDELQAGLLRVKLSHLNELNKERRVLAARYTAEITNPLVRLPKVRKEAGHTWHQYVVHSPRRNALAAFLAERGIGTQIHYPYPPHLSKAYACLGYTEGDFPLAERFAAEVLSLPMYNGISYEEQSAVIEAVNAFPKEG